MPVGYVAGFSDCYFAVPAFPVGREELQGCSLAGDSAYGMRHAHERAGGLHIPLLVYRYLPVVARPSVREGFLFLVGNRAAVSHSAGCLVLGGLPAGRAAVRRFDAGGEYRTLFPEDVLCIARKSAVV